MPSKALTVAIGLLAVASVRISAQTHSFAIVTDPATYENCRGALETYRDAVRNDGIDAFIVHKAWNSPDELRDSLKTYYASRDLEGAVFVGDVPVAMVRKAQHFTSAFKMDEGGDFPMRENSVPSDRFYDDFDLKFDYVGRDSVETNFFYYNLSPSSPQYIECDIYTGRIKPSVKRGDPYGEVSRYLLKAAAAKKNPDRLDHLMSYSGNGSFSNSLAAWKDETITLEEQFPAAFTDASSAKFYVFAMYPIVKDKILKEISRKDLDLAIFHEHGVPERQYLSGIPQGEDEEGRFNSIKYCLHTEVRVQMRRGKTQQEAWDEIIKKYSLTPEWVDDVTSPEIEKEDSLFNVATVIELDDIVATAPNVKLTIFDACYNGDFREDECVASRYIFSDGDALVGIGNSVNVLQDKSSSDLLGMLACGYSVGEWMQQVNILESHIIGDPTFHFAAENGTVKPDLRNTDASYWLGYLGGDYPCDIKGLALHKLYSLRYEGLSDLMLKTYRESDEYMLRLQCLHLLAHYNDGNYSALLRESIDDPYEFIRRKSAYFMGDVAEADMVDSLAAMYLRDYNSLRVAFNITSAAGHFPDGAFMKALDKKISEAGWIYDKEGFRADAENAVRLSSSLSSSTPEALKDKEMKPVMRDLYIRGMRNNPYVFCSADLINFIKDSSEDTALRVLGAEALGWFVRAHNRSEIIASVEKYLAEENDVPQELRDELTKTLGRLKDYTR